MCYLIRMTDSKFIEELSMNLSDPLWIALFFLASGVLGALFGRSEKKAREKRIEYFKRIPGITEE